MAQPMISSRLGIALTGRRVTADAVEIRCGLRQPWASAKRKLPRGISVTEQGIRAALLLGETKPMRSSIEMSNVIRRKRIWLGLSSPVFASWRLLCYGAAGLACLSRWLMMTSSVMLPDVVERQSLPQKRYPPLRLSNDAAHRWNLGLAPPQ
jgi:hypothetical protein